MLKKKLLNFIRKIFLNSVLIITRNGLFSGMVHSWTDFFRGIRDARVDKYVVETNKILIRLDKLISAEVPNDSGKRKGNSVFLIYVVVIFYNVVLEINKSCSKETFSS